MSEAVFLVPIAMWHGATPTAPDLASAEAHQLLWQLDGALLLLEMAGYQSREVVIDVPEGDPTGTDLRTGTTGPPGHSWAPAPAPGKVGIFVGPRTGMGALEEASAAHLTLTPVNLGATRADAPGLAFGFSPTTAGWLTLPVVPYDDVLYTGIAPAIETLLGALRSGIVDAYEASHPGPDDVPTPGLLSMLDPSTWNVSSGSVLPDPKAWAQYGPTLVELGRNVRWLALEAGAGLGLRTFLAQETSTVPARSTLTDAPGAPDPSAMRRHSVLERLGEWEALFTGPVLPIVDVQPGQWLAGMYAALRPGAQAPVTVAELDWLTWTQLLMILQSVGVVDFLSYRLAADAGDLYGGNDLKIGDTSPEVGDLQRDLRALGFTMIDAAESGFGLTTDWAVREFQIYAAMPSAARWLRDTFPYADGLTQVQVLPEQRYPGLPTGAVDADTRAAIARWQVNNWRCPVVAEAWEMSGNRSVRVRVAAGLDNIWAYNAVTDKLLQVFVRDFSGAYTVPPAHAADPWRVVGQLHESLGGPSAWPARHQSWPEAELLTDAAGGGELSPERASMFKVVRMVAEVECFGFLDSLTAYDNTFVSLGVCHWTFGQFFSDRVVAGELAGFLAYLADQHADIFAAAVERYGLRPSDAWAGTGQPYLGTQRTYVGWFSRPNVDGDWTPLPSGRGLAGAALAEAMAAGNVHRSWHWLYRWQMAGRTMLDWRRACFDFGRIRVRDLLSAPWGSTGNGGIPDLAEADVTTEDRALGFVPGPVKIGDVFRSERAVALLLRWHVKAPAELVSADARHHPVTYTAAATLRSVYTTAKAARLADAPTDHPMEGPPTRWTDDDEVALIAAIMTVLADRNYVQTLVQVQNWPTWASGPNPSGFTLPTAPLLPVGEDRHTGRFLPDYTGLPTAPNYDTAVGR
jgi:hypothetical protein